MERGDKIFCTFSLQQLNANEFQEQLSQYHALKVTQVAYRLFLDKIKDFNDLKDLCLAYTGSDGRKEKLSPYSSPMELMFIVRRSDDLKSDVLEKIKLFVIQHSKLFCTRIEVRCLEC